LIDLKHRFKCIAPFGGNRLPRRGNALPDIAKGDVRQSIAIHRRRRCKKGQCKTWFCFAKLRGNRLPPINKVTSPSNITEGDVRRRCHGNALPYIAEGDVRRGNRLPPLGAMHQSPTYIAKGDVSRRLIDCFLYITEGNASKTKFLIDLKLRFKCINRRRRLIDCLFYITEGNALPLLT